MSCNDMDEIRTRLSRGASPAWPKEAREHLESCPRCRQLQTLLDNAEPVDLPADAFPEDLFPAVLKDKIEAAILPGLRPVSPLPSVWRIAVTLLCCAVLVVAAANSRLGVAGWHARGSLQRSVDFSLLILSFTLLASLLADQMAPGGRLTASTEFYLVGSLIALLAAVAFLFGNVPDPRFLRATLSCWEIGVTCAALAAPLFWLVLRRGFPLHPVAHGAAAGLLAGLTGVTVLEIYCPYLDRAHISLGHIGAAVTTTLLGAALGGVRSKLQDRLAL